MTSGAILVLNSGSSSLKFAVLEPRSQTMRMGVHQDTLAPSLAGADEVWLYAPPDLGWDTGAVMSTLGARGHVSGTRDLVLVPKHEHSVFGGDDVRLDRLRTERDGEFVRRSRVLRAVPARTPMADDQRAGGRERHP